MKAIRVHAYGGPDVLQFEECEAPVPGRGEIAVKLAATSINPMDLKIRSGLYKDVAPRPMPYIPGVDVAGFVEAIGDGTDTLFKLGDRVAGLCMAQGAYAETIVCRADILVALPDNLPFEPASALPLAGLTSAQAISSGYMPAVGDRVLVSGALGAIGRLLVQQLRALGATVTAGVRRASSYQAADLDVMDVMHLDDPRSIDMRAAQFDAVYDVVGSSIAQQLLRTVRQDGVLVALNPPVPEASIEGVTVRPVIVKADAELLRRLIGDLSTGRLAVQLASVLPLQHAAAGHRLAAASGSDGKVVLVP